MDIDWLGWQYLYMAWFQGVERSALSLIHISESGESYGADNLLKSRQGVYVRKKSDDLDVNSSPLYKYVALDTKEMCIRDSLRKCIFI